MTTLNRNLDLTWKTITSNGTTVLGKKLFGVSDLLIFVSGVFASGSLQLSYKNEAGTFVPFISVSAITTAGEIVVPIGKGMIIAVVTTAATGSTVINFGFVAEDFILP